MRPRRAYDDSAAPTCVEIKFSGAHHAVDAATCFRVCSMAWRFHAIDATLSPWPRRLDGVEQPNSLVDVHTTGADDAAVVQQNDCRLPHLNIHQGVDARPLDLVASRGVHAVLERSGCDVANCSLEAARATAWSTTAPANHHLCGRAHHHRHHRKKPHKLNR